MSMGPDRGHSSSTRRARTRLACTIVLLLALGLPHAQEKPLPDLESLLQGLRKTLHSDRVLLSQYTYVAKEHRKADWTRSGRVTKTEVEVLEMYPSLEEDLSYARLISKNGKPVDPKELEKKDREQQKKVLDRVRKHGKGHGRRESQAAGEGRGGAPRRRTNRSTRRLLSTAISMKGRDVVDGHDAIVLEFRARPDFKVKTDAGKILKKLKGRAWIDERDHELIRIEVDLVDIDLDRSRDAGQVEPWRPRDVSTAPGQQRDLAAGRGTLHRQRAPAAAQGAARRRRQRVLRLQEVLGRH